jgi:DNA-binding response OmpR family regulator
MRFSRGIHSALPSAVVLVVDADAPARGTMVSELRRLNLDVSEAESGAAAIAAVRIRQFDLALIDFVLSDMSGLDVAVAMRKEQRGIPWLLMSSRMTPPLAVEAMRLGAIDAVSRPFAVKGVVTKALRSLSERGATKWPRVRSVSRLSSPKSAAERWASLVLRGCAAEHDLKTIGDWALVAGISYSALTESCRLVGTRPHDARDFLRMLRALAQAGGRVEHLEHGLNVNDHRTLKTLFERAGLTGRSTETISLQAFIDRQRFVDPSCEPVRLMLKMIGAAGDDGLRDPRGGPHLVSPTSSRRGRRSADPC